MSFLTIREAFPQTAQNRDPKSWRMEFSIGTPSPSLIICTIQNAKAILIAMASLAHRRRAMIEIELTVPSDCDFKQVASRIDQIILNSQLQITLRGSLASYPGCTHWHTKRENQKGTLEITSFPRDRRVWLKLQSGRNAPWIEPAAAALQKAIERELRGSVDIPLKQRNISRVKRKTVLTRTRRR